jgi:hypothetical protein
MKANTTNTASHSEEAMLAASGGVEQAERGGEGVSDTTLSPNAPRGAEKWESEKESALR